MVRTLITQNVDGLHAAAGSRAVIDLHGRIDRVICLHCGDLTSRLDLHHRLDGANPDFATHADVRTAPDSDVELEEASGFTLVGCRSCRGVLKPDVVFFGENVPRARVDRCTRPWRMVMRCWSPGRR